MGSVGKLPRYIEIETSRQCNRKCPWCPVGNSESRTDQELMQWNLFEKIILELATLSFVGNIGLTNYNEPLLNPRLVEEVKFIKSKIPSAKIRIYTNGDKLSLQNLNELSESGISFLRVTLYPSVSMKNYLPKKQTISKWILRKGLTGFSWSYQSIRQGLAATTQLNSTEIEIVSPDLRNYSYRGGTAKSLNDNYVRTEPCYITYHSASIDYSGRMKMCCCVFPDLTKHDYYVLGNLKFDSFISIWNSDKLNDWRRKQSTCNWSASPICANCSHHSPPSKYAYE